MKRVRGPESVTGNCNVIEYLNSSQVDKWPMVKYDDIQSIRGRNYGAVTCPKGTYTHSWTFNVPVAFCFKYDAAHGKWLVANANCTPN